MELTAMDKGFSSCEPKKIRCCDVCPSASDRKGRHICEYLGKNVCAEYQHSIYEDWVSWILPLNMCSFLLIHIKCYVYKKRTFKVKSFICPIIFLFEIMCMYKHLSYKIKYLNFAVQKFEMLKWKWVTVESTLL